MTDTATTTTDLDREPTERLRRALRNRAERKAKPWRHRRDYIAS